MVLSQMEQQPLCLRVYQTIQPVLDGGKLLISIKLIPFYTAPTAIRALMREGDKPVKKLQENHSSY